MSAAKTRRARPARKPAARKPAAAKSKPAPGKPKSHKPAARKPAPPKPVAKPKAAAPKAAPHPAHGPTVTIGKPVPDFSLPASGAGTWQLRDARARKLVLYFYPRDNTPGCTLEGQQFAALAPRFEHAGATIVGISRDSVASHDRFRAQMKFPFILLSDADGAACALFDVIREKNMYGRKVMGIERSTFLLDGEGILRREWRKLAVDGHALAVLEAVQAL
jgi:thioredoxin-dependent peroxiredoxin